MSAPLFGSEVDLLSNPARAHHSFEPISSSVKWVVLRTKQDNNKTGFMKSQAKRFKSKLLFLRNFPMQCFSLTYLASFNLASNLMMKV